ncbi:helix-turn-helix domain-containing protein [Vibrio pectenicida]|uniref:XRE family transcriptional regulator n=1 Tax=Vibrio pectenicida TaxID=62763 RepID=A0A427U5W6_9VIBR|nr:helix-turn-helix transcriptional regulator [Vibrio pectenicida]RSD31972.1 XRE family transcriptional regulator [Vibrio pectenicida]
MSSVNNENDPIIEYLVHLRVSKRVTQQQISDATGIKLSTYQRLERGERDPKLSELKSLFKYYEVTWLDFAWVELGKRQAHDADLAAAMKQLPEHIRKPIIDLIRAVS